jgi:hypothetical protein
VGVSKPEGGGLLKLQRGFNRPLRSVYRKNDVTERIRETSNSTARMTQNKLNFLPHIIRRCITNRIAYIA